jgi:hypothetical protein
MPRATNPKVIATAILFSLPAEQERTGLLANWKVLALISGEIEAVSGPAAQNRPGAHEWTVWEGPTADKGEGLQSAEKADPRVDLEWMRIR